MSYLSERQAIQSRFGDEWGDRTEVSWPNVDFSPPSGEAWVRFRVQSGPAAQVAMGGPENLYRHDGDVVIEVFAPRGHGERAALEHADLAAAAFRAWRTAELTFWTPRLTPAEVVDGWWKVDVICPFQRDNRFPAAS